MLLLLAMVVLPMIAAIGLHWAGVIDLSDYGILPAKQDDRTAPYQETPQNTERAQQPSVQLTPEQAVTHLMTQAAAAQSRGETAVALERLEGAVEIMPEDAQLYCLLEPLYRSAGRVADAARTGERCAELSAAEQDVTGLQEEEQVEDQPGEADGPSQGGPAEEESVEADPRGPAAEGSGEGPTD